MEKLKSLSLAEPLVDCDSCKVRAPLSRSDQPRPYKCCTYQPFWSAVLLGQRLLSQQAIPAFPKNTVFLPVGVVPAPRMRQLQEEMLPAERAQDPKMLCPYADAKKIRCRIFAHRPLECRRYYCASQGPDRDVYRDKVFHWSQSVQGEALKKVLFQQGYSQEDWAQWQDYLDNPGWRNPPHKAFADWQEAQSFYEHIAKDLEQILSGVEPPNFSVILKDHDSH